MYRDRAAQRRTMYTETWDADGNGEIDEEERRVAGGYYRQRFEDQRRRWTLQRYDANKDGILDEQETAKRDEARQRMRERFRRGRGRRGRRGRRGSSGDGNREGGGDSR